MPAVVGTVELHHQTSRLIPAPPPTRLAWQSSPTTGLTPTPAPVPDVATAAPISSSEDDLPPLVMEQLGNICSESITRQPSQEDNPQPEHSRSRAQKSHVVDRLPVEKDGEDDTKIWHHRGHLLTGQYKIERGKTKKVAAHPNPQGRADELINKWSWEASSESLPAHVREHLSDGEREREGQVQLATSCTDHTDTPIKEWELHNAIKSGHSTAPEDDGITYDIIETLVNVSREAQAIKSNVMEWEWSLYHGA
ncbi:hypothetical protein Pmani_027813 [Petrolisthes manimaculis]|uniref:Uncharacterized protein n=1 Tax=Petrolisthes manimaculis TaxID=1843537 RepID=A0AAE1TVE8_9EUCA|nr:hypothetical protein Pmani_027813 [Petrolisthes manimaculis]